MIIEKVPSKIITLPLSAIDMQQEIYVNVPEYQREAGIWKPEQRRRLVYTALRQLPIPPIITYRENGRFFILDGLQRLTTLLNFLHDGFRTATEKEFRRWTSTISEIPVIQPGKKFSQMLPEYQEAFQFTDITLIQIDRLTPEERSLYFVDLQGGTRLSVGEMYQAYTSEANRFAKQLTFHEYFDTIYHATAKDRGKKYQMCLCVLEMAVTHLHADLRKEYFLPLVTGNYDKRLTVEKKQEVTTSLEHLCYLFAGVESYSLTDIIPMYQATRKLLDRGLDVTQAHRGCLKPWIEQVRATAVTETWGHSVTFGRMQDGAKQRAFWEEQEERMLQFSGLYSQV